MSLFSDKLLEAGQQAQWNSPVYDTQGVAPHYDVEEDEDAGTISKLGHRLLGGLEGFGGDALKGIGTYLDYLDEKGRESSYIDSIRDSDGGYLKDAGDWFINNGQYLSNDATTMRQKYGSGDKYADKSLGELLTDPDYLFSSDGAIGDAMEGIGSTLPFIALNYLIPGSGLVSRGLKGASGLDRIIYGLAKTPEARKEAMKILATGEGRETLAGLARQQGLNAGDNAARRAAMWALDKGAGTAGDNALKWAYSAGPMDALTNAAGMYDDLKEQGYSYEDMVKAMGTSAKEELPLDMLNMALFGTVTKGTVGNLLKGTAKPKKIIGNLLGLPIEGLSEDYQEAMQQRLNNKYTGKEYGTWDNPTPDEAAAGAQGFIGSLLPGAFGTGMGIRHSFKGQDDRATRIGTAWDNIRSLNGEPPITNSAMDMIAEANASTNAKLAAENAAAQKAAEQATAQPAFAVAEPPTGGDDGGAGAGGTDGLDVGFGKYDGQRMDNGANGCVEAVTKMGASYSPFLAQELSKGVVYVPTLVQDAGDAVIPFSPENVERGDIIVYGDDDHVVTADGNGGYYGNSTSQQKVLHGDDYTAMGGLQPTKIIKTGGGGLNAGVSMSGGSADVSSLPYGNIAMAISQRTGIPAQFVWAQMAWETGDFSSGLSVDDHNYGGIKRNDGSGEYRHFDSDEDYIDYASKNLNAYKENGIGNAKTIDEFAAALHDGGYFTDDLGHYTEGLKAKLAANGLPESGSGRASSSAPSGANFLNEKPSFDISREDEAGRKMVADFIDYWQNRAGVDDADTIQGMLDANGKFRNTQENRDTVREKWGDELQQYADEHMTDEQQQAARAAQMQQQDTASARKAAQPSKKLANKDNTQPTIEVSTPNLDAAKQQTASATPQPQAITPDDITTEAPNANAQANMPAVSQTTQLSQQSATQTAQTTQAAPIEQAKAPTVQPNTEHSAPNTAQTPAMDAQQAVKQDNTLPNAQAPQASAQAQAQQRARAAKEQRLQKELETNATIDQIERGQQLEAAAKQNGVPLPKGMAGSLHRGQAPAIAQATELLQQKGVSLPTVEASGSTVYGKAESNNGWGSTERARFHRKLKKARAGLKKQKPKSKDERELVNSIDKAYQDIQDALEGLKNGTMSAKDAGHLIWKRHGEVASKWQNTKNKKRYLGTRGAYENAFNDATTEVHYASVEAGEDNSRSTEEPTVDPVTSKQVMQGYRDAIDETVDDYYKGELTAEESHIEMERTLEKAQGEPESRAREEDQQAFDEYVTQKENEVAEDNRQKLDGHMRERNEAKSQAKEAVANGGRGNSAQPPRKQLTTKASYTDKSQEHGRGSLNGDKITAWDGSKGGIPKKDLNFSVTLDEIEKALASYGNGRAGLRKLVKQRYDAAVERWIESAKNPEVRAKRRHYWEDDTIHMKGGAAYDRAVDSYARVVEHLYEAATGQKAESPFERHMRERSKEKQQEKAAPSNAGRDNSAQNPAAPRKVEPAKNASGQQMEKPSSKKSTPSRKPVKGKAGKPVTVTTDSGKELHARYRIVPASSLTTSNVYDGDTIAKNDAYPQELQPRERSGRKEMQAQTDGMAADLHPADLEASRNLNQGAPLIRSDGVVLNGNGRTMAITRAYALRNQAGKRYAQYLVEHAEDFGFTKDQMRAAVTAKGMDKPVLVRELTDDVDADTTQEIINSKIGGASMSATEQAEADAKRIKSSDFNDYDQESDGDLTKGSNDGFVSKLLRKLIGKDEANKYTDKNGQVNQDGYRRVKRAIFSRAYGDTDLIAKMAESMDDAIKNISNGLQSAAANIARLNLKMQEGDAYDYPLAKTIARAVKKYNSIKEGKAEANVEAYANENETSLTGGDPEEVVKMVQALDDFHRSGKKVGVFLNHLADILDHQGSPKEDATAFDFGEASKPLTLSEAIDQAKEKTVTGGEQDLFGAPKYSIEKAKERHERTLADLKREIASAFPGAKNVREDGDRIAFDMPNGSHLEIWTTDNIELSSEEEAQAKRDHGVTGDMHIKVNGYEVTVGKDAIIALSKAGEKGTAYHEVLHIAMDILFSDREKAALAKKFGKGRGTVEEHIAEAFRRYKLAREYGAHVPFGKLFQRIQDFFANLADHYKELRGTMTDADVARRAFRELANGKAWERDAGEGRGARKFAGEANADENPVDNGNEQADNEGERKLRESLIEKVTDASFIRHISDRMTVEQIREQLLTQDLQHKDSLVRRFEDIERKAKIFHMTEEDAKKLTDSVRKVLKDALRIINAKRRLFNEPEVRGQLEHALRSADKIGSGSRLEKSLSDRRGRTSGLDAGRPDERLAAELVPGEHKRVSHPIEEEIQKELTEENHGQHYSISRSDSQDGFSRAKNPRKFAGEANADENPVDNRNGQNDNEGEERARFIDRLLNEKVPENGRTSIDSDVKDGIARFGKEITPENVEDVFDSLHCVRMLRATFNDNGRMQNYANGLDYAQKMAAYMYGYARRCFENDERIKRQLALRGASVGRPEEVRNAHAEGRPGRTDEGAPRNGRQALQGTSLAKHGNVKALQELYDKLVDEAYHGKQYSVSRSDNQDGFSRAQNPRKYSIAYHGTQHEFDQFDVGKIGSGEGSQVHGWGIYFAKDRKISEGYRDLLSDNEHKGMLAEVEVPDDDVLLDEQKNGAEQPKGVRKALHAIVEDIQKSMDKMHEVDKVLADKSKSLDERLGFEAEDRDALLSDEKTLLNRVAAARTESDDKALGIYNWITMFEPLEDGRSGKEIYEKLSQLFGGDDRASRILNEYGVKGIKYNGHRDGDCYVVFDDKAVSIIRKLSASRAKEARARAMEDIKAEVLKAFPGAKDVRDTGDRITFTMPNGAKVAIRIHDNMTVTGEEASRARRAHGIADGVTITVNGSEYTIGRQAVIDLSQRGEVGTVYHEALHVAMDLLFDDKTKAALMKKYGSEEKIADAYRKFMLAEARGGHVPFGKPLRAIRDFFRALASHIAPIRKACGDAWTAQKAFEDLASGKAWEPASKKSHGLSLFSHAEAAERPIDNEAARGDNEAKRENQRIEQKNQKVFASVRDAFTKEVQMLRDKGWKESSIIRAMNDENSEYRKRVVEPFARVYNQFHAKGSNKRDVVQRILGEKAFADLMQKNPTRRQEAIAEVFQQLSDRMEGVMNDARKTCIELADRFGNGQDVAGLHSWRDIEASSRKHHGGAAFTEHPAEVNHEQHHSVSRSETQDGFSDARKSGKDVRYSVSEEESQSEEETKKRAKGWLHSVGDKLAKGLHLKGEKIMLEEDAKDPSRDINLKQYIAASPSRVAEKVKTFRVLYVMADRAMNKVVSLRDGFERKLNKALALASSKDDRQDLFDLLLRGDAEGKEWTRQELIDDGVKENVADAYIQIRRQLNRAYHLVNDARRKPTPKSETVDKDRLAFLKANKFVTDLSVKDKGDGKYLVSYKEYKNYPKTYKEVGADMVERFQHDPGIQVVDVKEAKTESGHAITDADGKPLYNVTTTEGPAELHKLKGYIPHFFHEYFLRVVDKDGNSRTIGSARNQREAVMQAEAWMKDHKLADGETIHVQPKVFDINKALGVSDDDFAPVMGDKDFLRVQKNLAKQNDMTLAEAKDMLDGAVRLKGRHRFFGNALHRTGAAGFETDLDWALRHYFNSASRYVAMETEFKPKAISYFERVFGAFDKDYNNNLLAKYCKDYINDINGTPSSLEQAISKALNSTWLFKKVVIPTFGDRAALTLGNGIANKISYMTLGLNMSSALLNFSQLMNSAAYIGDVRSLGQMMKKGMHRDYSLHELRILKETGVLNDIGIDSGSGYDKLRGGGSPSLGTGKIARALTGVNRGVDFLGQKSMYFFQQADSICRRGTVLVAYEKARKEGKSHAEAIAYAKDVNNKANFQYGTQDAPNIFRRGSIVSQLALQFKKYGFKELEVMADFSPWSKKTSRKQKLMFWGMYALLCGAMGVPALDWLDEIFGEKTGFYTKDELQKAIIHLCGGNKRLAVSLMYGIPAAFNINLSSRAGMSDVIPTSLGDFAGPTISKSVRLAQDLLGGDYANALRDVNPGLYNLYAAGTGESRGKRDRLNDRYVTAWDRILRAVGFRSVDETIPTDMQRIISREKSAATKERQDAMDDYLKNPTSENKQRLKDFGIKEKDVQKEATKKNQTREERTQGTVPKKDKDKYKPLTDFMKE